MGMQDKVYTEIIRLCDLLNEYLRELIPIWLDSLKEYVQENPLYSIACVVFIYWLIKNTQKKEKKPKKTYVVFYSKEKPKFDGGLKWKWDAEKQLWLSEKGEVIPGHTDEEPKQR